MIFTWEGLDSIWQLEIAVQVEVDVDSSAHVTPVGCLYVDCLSGQV